MAAGYSIGLSLISLLYSLDLIIRRIFNVTGIFTSNYSIFLLVTVVALFSFTVFYSCDYEKFEANNLSKVKKKPIRTFFSLLFVFGPAFLMPVLMYLYNG
jgi:magnesium-transporting ATPase (P-type)